MMSISQYCSLFDSCTYSSIYYFFFFLMIRQPPRSTLSSSSAASDVYKRQGINAEYGGSRSEDMSEKDTGVDGVLFIFFSLLVGLAVQVIWAESKLLQRYLPLPFTVVIFLIGLAWGYCTPKYGNGADLDHAMNNLVGIDPHLFLQVFIPPLLFESGWAMNIHMFKKVLAQCIWLASIGVVFSMMATALLGYYVYPDNWSWNSSLIYGAMTAATDPVAVAAVLKELGAPVTLATVIEGESLLNDGTSFVFFSVFLKRAGESQSAGDIAKTLFQMSFGGAAFGAVMGLGTAIMLKMNYHRNNLFFECMITLTMPFITFWTAENPLGTSGVLATVVMALIANKEGRFFVRHQHSVHQFWEHLAFISNTIVFMISGALVGEGLADRDFHDAGFQIVNYLFLNLIRAIVVYGSMPLLKRTGYSFDAGKAAVATWGGLRGAVGLAMAIMVLHDHNIDKTTRTTIFDYTAMLVLFTLCINGTSTGALLRFFQYDRVSSVRLDQEKDARKALIETGEEWIEGMEQAGGCMTAQDWEIVRSNLTRLDNHTANILEAVPILEGRINKSEEIREQVLVAFSKELYVASEAGVLDSKALFYMKESCDMLLDPKFSSLCVEDALNDWWIKFLQPQADRLIKPTCLLNQQGIPVPVAGRYLKTMHLRRVLLGVELALGFQAIVARVCDEIAAKQGVTVDGRTSLTRTATSPRSSRRGEDPAQSEDAEIECDLLEQLQQAAGDAQAWLDSQAPGLINMAETRRTVKHFLLEIEQKTTEFEHSGRLGAAEAEGVLGQIRHLQAKNHYSYTSRKFQSAFHNRAPEMQKGDVATHGEKGTKMELPEMGTMHNQTNYLVDEELPKVDHGGVTSI
eukprot:TRINITY_DN18018_c0_g1_i1.p1 TRINITY_DN18018_c0_g1~~TRINITY_DN18018_c0_g1_i1.p1  ORF type:complete len:856 (+),score=202.22 TRINITY_DN18018_c0_g1_i1:1-2568(+)